MTELSRRHCSRVRRRCAAPLAATVPGHAAAPAAGKQAAGFYRYKVGDIEVTVVTDGANRLPITDAFVVNVKKEEVNAALVAAFMEPGVFVGAVQSDRAQHRRQARAGRHRHERSGLRHRAKARPASFMTNLAAAGIDAARSTP